MKNINPLLKMDFPDLDVIRVNDTYYMVSTTMHFFPGCVILRSYDLVHWEVATHVYEHLDDTDKQRLKISVTVRECGRQACVIIMDCSMLYLWQTIPTRVMCTRQGKLKVSGSAMKSKDFIMIVPCFLMMTKAFIWYMEIEIFI